MPMSGCHSRSLSASHTGLYDDLVNVCLLWHVHHAEDTEGRARHQGTLDGNWYADEEEGDQVLLLGVYSTEAKANDRIRKAKGLPGFGSEPDCFLVDSYEVDDDKWATGYLPG